MTIPAEWYFDYVSPFAYLQLLRFEELPADLEIRPVPVLFAGLLSHWDNMGPAEIPAKRRQTYRYSHWLAAKRGAPFRVPPRHPFNPLALLRLTVAVGPELSVVRRIFHHVWGEGHDGEDPESVRAVARALGVAEPATLIGEPSVKATLRDNTDRAVAKGVFGIPTFVIGDEVFWGDDVTAMMLDYLADPSLFEKGEFGRISDLPVASARRQSRL